jgi:hypothetical protein
MSKLSERQNFIQYYKEQTRETELDMRKVAEFALKKGWSLPKPADPVDLLAKQFTDAARQEIRRDTTTNRPYRAYHAIPVDKQGSGQLALFRWIDIDDPNTTTKNFRKSAVGRRDQMIDDGVHLSLDLDHWNAIHPNTEDQLDLPWDLTLDIEIRRASFDMEHEEPAA